MLIPVMNVHLYTQNGKAYDYNCIAFKSNNMEFIKNQSLNK